MVSWAALTLQILYLRPWRGSEAAEGGSALPLCLQHRAGTKRARRMCCVCRYIVRVCDVGCGTEAMLLGFRRHQRNKSPCPAGCSHSTLGPGPLGSSALSECGASASMLGRRGRAAGHAHPPPTAHVATLRDGSPELSWCVHSAGQHHSPAYLPNPKATLRPGLGLETSDFFWSYLLDTLGTVHSVITDPDSTRRGANTTLQVKKLKHRAPYNFHVTQVHVGAATGI